MTELEIMQHAKDYLDKLAKGIDPLTDREVPESDIINNVRISRCLVYVSGVLQQVIENGGIHAATPVRNGEKTPFSLSYEERARFSFGDWPATASTIAQRLNEPVDLNTMQKLKTTSITRFLLQSGLLFEEVGPSGNKHKRPTEAGWKLGISTADARPLPHPCRFGSNTAGRKVPHYHEGGGELFPRAAGTGAGCTQIDGRCRCRSCHAAKSDTALYCSRWCHGMVRGYQLSVLRKARGHCDPA